MNKEIKFDIEKQNKIKEMMTNKQFKYARQAALRYLSDYPKDPLVKNLLGMTYLIEGNLEIADACFTNNLGTKDENYAKYFLIKIAIERGDYELAYTYCHEILGYTTDDLTKKDIRRAINYIEEILNVDKDQKYVNDNYKYDYTCKQLEEYNIGETYNHIKKHQVSRNNGKASFCKNMDLKQLLIETSQKIQHMKEEYYPIRLIGNCYYFYYPNIGEFENQKTDYFRVITFPNSKNIITMYPVFPEEVYDIKNTIHFLEEAKDFTYDENIKAKTGIERFNTRYKRK